MHCSNVEERKRGWYMCFTKSTDQSKAVEKFIAKYGTEPAEIFESKGLLWLGPVTVGEFPDIPDFR